MNTLFDDLESGRIDPEGFSHRHHLIAGFQALQRHEFFEAVDRYARALRALTEKAGMPEKYNATLTLAFMSLIAERMETEGETADAFLDRNADLLDARTVLSRFAAPVLSSPRARKVALLPRA